MGLLQRRLAQAWELEGQIYPYLTLNLSVLPICSSICLVTDGLDSYEIEDCI